MATNPTENSRKYMGIIVDRDDPNGLGGHKVFIPQLHGHDVKPEHLPWVRYTVPPGSGGAGTNYGALDNGQLVSIEKDTGEGGTGFGTIVGLYQTKQKADPNMPGNVSLIKNFSQIADALERESNIRIRPEIEEVVVNGARVRQLKEKGKKHKHSLLKETMSHAATFPLNGTILPQLQNISTGAEPSINILSTSLQSLLPGSSINLNQLFSLIPKELMDELEKTVPLDALVALENTTALMGGVTTSAASGMTAGRKVDPTSFILSAVDLLKSTKTPADINRIFTELNTNTSIGMVNTEAINVPVATPFGLASQVIDPLTGAISLVMPDDVKAASDAFATTMTSTPGVGGTTMFGDTGTNVNATIQRLKDPSLVSSLTETMQQSVGGGNPIRAELNGISASMNTVGDAFSQLEQLEDLLGGLLDDFLGG
jgi:hypothetical protein